MASTSGLPAGASEALGGLLMEISRPPRIGRIFGQNETRTPAGGTPHPQDLEHTEVLQDLRTAPRQKPWRDAIFLN